MTPTPSGRSSPSRSGWPTPTAAGSTRTCSSLAWRVERPAKAVCRACDVQAECLAYAVNNGETKGTWGETSEMDDGGCGATPGSPAGV